MDYGQPMQDYPGRNTLSDEQVFFTSGNGNDPEDFNRVEPENNLDLTNTATAWNNSDIQSNRERGRHAVNIVTSSLPLPDQINSPMAREISPGIGEVIELTPPPGMSIEESTARPMDENTSATHQTGRFDVPTTTPEIIKTGERLNEAGIKKIEKARSKLNQDDNIADFYDEVRGLMVENLKNSYNREVSQW